MDLMLAAIAYKTFPSFHVGPITLRTFGLFVALGLVVGTGIFLRYARDRGMDTDLLTRLAWWVIILGLIGSRLLFVLTHWSEFTDDPMSAFAIWQGGLQFSGAFLVTLGIIWVFRRRHPEIDGRQMADGMALGLVPGLLIGRIGCIAVGEHLGGPTNFFLGWKYMGGSTREGPIAVGTTIHNTAIYELLLLIPLTLFMFWLVRRHVAPGWIVTTFLLWYGVQRFLTDFLRSYDKTRLGLTGAQYICIGMVAGGLVMAARLLRASPGKPALPEPDAAVATG
jgi:phosphatidylglycerol---prolipoprotein diacylglyceryl transferase